MDALPVVTAEIYGGRALRTTPSIFAKWIAELACRTQTNFVRDRDPASRVPLDMTELKRVVFNGWFWVGMLLTLLVRATWFT
jgi:hypothetical protein